MQMLFVLLLLIPAIGMAQTVELSPSQLQYNEEAVQLLKEQRYTEAITKLEASLILGESNIVLLNLGRAHQRMGNCAKARGYFARVLSVPQVPSPTPDEIAQVLARFQGELPTTCPSQVALKCPNDVLSVKVGDLKLKCNGNTEIAPGEHTAVATNSFGSKTFNFTVQDEETVSLSVQGPDSAPAAAASNPLKVTGVVLGSIGAGALITGLILDAFWLHDRGDKITSPEELDDAQDKQFANKVILGSGAGLLVAGATLYLIGAISESEVALVPSLGADYAGIGLSGAW